MVYFFYLVEEKIVWQISYPPANDASQGNFFLPKMGVHTCSILTVTFRRSRTTEEILPI